MLRASLHLGLLGLAVLCPLPAAEGGRLVFDDPVTVPPEPPPPRTWGTGSDVWSGWTLRLAVSSLPLSVVDADRTWFSYGDAVSETEADVADADRAGRVSLGGVYRSDIGGSPFFGWTFGAAAAYSRFSWDDAGNLPVNPWRDGVNVRDLMLVREDRLELDLQNAGGLFDIGLTTQVTGYLHIDLTGQLGLHYAWGEVGGRILRTGPDGVTPIPQEINRSTPDGAAWEYGGKLGVYLTLGRVELGAQGGWMGIQQDLDVVYDRQSLRYDEYEYWYPTARRSDRLVLQGLWAGASLGWGF